LLPVKDTMLMPGWPASAAPASSPSPVTFRPGQAGCRGQSDILGDHAFGKAEGTRNLFMGELGVELQTQYILDFTHSDPLRGHAVSRQKAGSVDSRHFAGRGRD
jgi:hypothetical protein